jgi:hypothetical protein
MKTTTHEDTNEHPLMFVARAWERFWFQPTDPTTLGLMRVCVGVIVLYVHLVYCIGLTGYLGPDTWVLNTGLTAKPQPGEEGVMDFLRNGNTFQAPSWTWDDAQGPIMRGQVLWSIYYHVEDPLWLWVIHSGILVIMFLFTIGLWTRVTSVLTWVGALMYIHRLPSMLFGMDTMTNLGLLYLMIAPCGAAVSLDRFLQVRREKRRLGAAYVPTPPEPRVSATFATRLIQINFCFIYFASGTSKLLGSSWWNGTAPNRFLLNYSFAPFEVPYYMDFITFLAKHRWMWELACAGGVVYTLMLEIGFPFLVWGRRTRWVAVAGSILLHTMIALLMGLVTFSLMMLALVLAFVPPEVVRYGLQAFAEQMRQLWARVRGGAAEPSLGLSR